MFELSYENSAFCGLFDNYCDIYSIISGFNEKQMNAVVRVIFCVFLSPNIQ